MAMEQRGGEPQRHEPVAAVVAAAGQGRRMGTLKQLLPWGESTVIATVVANLRAAGAAPVLCVLGHQADQMREALQESPACLLYNARYAQGEMLSSYQAGVAWLLEQEQSRVLRWTGALLAPGDQPHVPPAVIGQVLAQARLTPDRLVIPSRHMRRGHPIYLPRPLWPELLALGDQESLRTLLRRRDDTDDTIVYVVVETDAILHDMDTPEQYRALQETWDQPPHGGQDATSDS